MKIVCYNHTWFDVVDETRWSVKIHGTYWEPSQWISKRLVSEVSLDDVLAVISTLISNLGFNETIVDIAKMYLDIFGESNRLMVLANGNLDTPEDVIWVFNNTTEG